MKQKLLPYVFVILFSIPAVQALFHPGFFASDDGDWMLIRFTAFHQAFVDGQFPIRFLGRLNQEYGYPVPNFNYPGFMYLSEIPKIVGFGFVDSIKILLGFSMVFSAVFAYLWLARIFEKRAAFLGCLFYLYAPYHLYDLYKRGSVGEVLALAVVPFIFWQLERRSVFFSSIGIAFLILSHNILALLFLPIIILYPFIKHGVGTIRWALTDTCLGLGLSAFFWIPALFDLQYTKFSQTQVSNWRDHFANIQLIGVFTLVIIVLSIYLVLFHSDTRKYRSIILFLILGLLSVFFSLKISSSVWEFLPVSFVQFPFRFLSLTIVSAAFLVAYLVFSFPKRGVVLGGFIVLLSIVSSIPFMTPSQYVDKGEEFYSTNMHSTTIKNEYMPKWVRIDPAERAKEKVVIVSGRGTIDVTLLKTNRVTFLANMESAGTVRVNTVYFPGWKSFVNGREVPISYENERGTMEMNVSQGKNDVTLSFGETRVRFVSDALSVVGIGALLVVGLSQKQKKLLA